MPPQGLSRWQTASTQTTALPTVPTPLRWEAGLSIRTLPMRGGGGCEHAQKLKGEVKQFRKRAFSSLQSPSNFPFFLVLPLLLDCSSTYFVEVLLIHL